MPSHNVITAYQTAGGSIGGTTTCSADTEINADVVLAAEATDVVLTVAIDVGQVVCLAMMCTAACTVKNSGGTTLATLVANVPRLCANNADATALLLADITSLKLTCALGGTFSLRTLQDQTLAV